MFNLLQTLEMYIDHASNKNLEVLPQQELNKKESFMK